MNQFTLPANISDPGQFLNEHVFPRFNRVGSHPTDRTGVLYVDDIHELECPIQRPSRVKIIGTRPPDWHAGSGCGFVKGAGFNGDVLIDTAEWAAMPHYSSFRATIKDLFLDCRGVAGINFRSAQHGELSGLVVRGFHDSYGIRLAGDTYTVERCDLLARGSGSSGAVPDSIGFYNVERLAHVAINDCTVHDCETGFLLGDSRSFSMNKYETETTNYPLAVNYHSAAGRLTDCRFLTNKAICKIIRAKFGKSFDLTIEGTTEAPFIKNAAGEKVDVPNQSHGRHKRFDIALKDYI